MTGFDKLVTRVEHAARRRRLQRAWRAFWTGLVVGACVWLAALLCYKLLPLPMRVLAIGAVLGITAPLVAAIVGLWRRESPQQTAIWLDKQQRLEERVSSAIEVGRDPKYGRWSELLIEDANRHLEGLDIRRILPWTLPKSSVWALLVLTLGAALGFVPEYRSASYLQKQRERETVRDTGRALADVTRRDLEKRAPALDATRRAVESVAELGEQLARKPLTKPEALRELAKLTEKVQQQAKELGKNPALRALATKQSDRSDKSDKSDRSDRSDAKTDSAETADGKMKASSGDLEKLKQDLERALQSAEALKKEGSAGDKAAQQNLADALNSLSQQAKELGLNISSLSEAIEALKSGETDQLLKDLAVADRDLEQLAETARALEQMQMQAERIGKDLPEQLQNGQATAARSTLQKMVNLLKSGNVDPKQLQSIMDELGRAIKPAGQYGKVADHLKQALQRMQGKDNAAAAQSLADAANELQKLMEQLADAESLEGALSALRRAQAAIGTGKCWSQAGKLGQPGFKPGGRPGRGVGTWADEDGWIEQPPMTGAWDNSGIERPEMSPRGITDRGEGELPEGLTPTKVRGKLSPGGPMPSVTLKGLSLKGSSKVEVQEAIRAAQTDAQSALSHDQVPRAYQGPVRDYFGDLK
ncbi:MAG: hypothetical protein ACP5MD_02055 [Verrucomicrobiia bacterium]